MKVDGAWRSVLIVFAFLVGCGGSDYPSAPDTTAATNTRLAPQAFAVAKAAVDYNTVVQQLYIAYFGRPADPVGLSNFSAQLANIGAPSDLQELTAVYDTNAAIRALVDSFGTSSESNALYSGDTTAFVTAVFRNVLNRAPAAQGLEFWVNAIDNGGLTRGRAALSIMAGALTNTSAQGVIDATLVLNKVTIAGNFTSSLDTASKVSSYSGSQAAGTVRTMLTRVTESTDTTAFRETINATVTALSNARPIANPGVAQSVTAGTFVTLDGRSSSDPNGSSLTYSWVLTSKPSTSNAILLFDTSSRAYFTADVAGTYVATLTVSDGTLTATASVTTTANVSTSTQTNTQSATARCRDGTYSYSRTRSGTCSHHGGVAVWL